MTFYAKLHVRAAARGMGLASTGACMSALLPAVIGPQRSARTATAHATDAGPLLGPICLSAGPFGVVNAVLSVAKPAPTCLAAVSI